LFLYLNSKNTIYSYAVMLLKRKHSITFKLVDTGSNWLLDIWLQHLLWLQEEG
ncbi:hypothetical protein ACJX0J_006274, partial [Zea mays]